MIVPSHIAQFWQSFVEAQAEDPTPRFFEACQFDDNERSANELAQLVLPEGRGLLPVSSGRSRRRRFRCPKLAI